GTRAAASRPSTTVNRPHGRLVMTKPLAIDMSVHSIRPTHERAYLLPRRHSPILPVLQPISWTDSTKAQQGNDRQRSDVSQKGGSGIKVMGRSRALALLAAGYFTGRGQNPWR